MDPDTMAKMLEAQVCVCVCVYDTDTKMLEAEEVARGYAASLINEHVYDTLNRP